MCKNRLIEKVEHAAALLDAGGDHRPDSLTPALARFAARALGNAPVDDHKPNRLFCQVVGRLDAGSGDESSRSELSGNEDTNRPVPGVPQCVSALFRFRYAG